MARAAGLAKRSEVNRKAAGKPTGGVRLGYNPPEYIGPPAGSVDPGLEAQVRQSERGLYDLIEKTHREGKYEDQDTQQAIRLLKQKIGQQRADIARTKGYARVDAGQAREQLTTSFERDIADLGQAKQRGEEDYNRALTNMQHKYATQAAQQGEASIRQGTSEEASTETASGAVRAANQGYDKSQVDLEHERHLADIGQQEGRVRENFDVNSGQIDQSLGREMTGLDIQGRRLGLQGRTQFKGLVHAALRADKERATTLSHAKREQALYSTDIASQAFFAAHENNPHILFPTPAATAGPPSPARTPGRIRQPGVGVGGPAPAVSHPHANAPIARGVGLGPGVSRPRRPYTRYS